MAPGEPDVFTTDARDRSTQQLLRWHLDDVARR